MGRHKQKPYISPKFQNSFWPTSEGRNTCRRIVPDYFLNFLVFIYKILLFFPGSIRTLREADCEINTTFNFLVITTGLTDPSRKIENSICIFDQVIVKISYLEQSDLYLQAAGFSIFWENCRDDHILGPISKTWKWWNIRFLLEVTHMLFVHIKSDHHGKTSPRTLRSSDVCFCI